MDDTTCVAAKVADYVDTYQRLTTAIHSRQPLTLIVRDRSVAQWLARTQEKYGENKVAIIEFTARLALERYWNIAIPPYVSDREIRETGLLEERLTTRTGQSFSDVVLENFYSPCLTYDCLPLHELANLVNDLDAERWGQNHGHILLRREYERRLDLWESVASNDGEQFIIQCLRNDPRSLANMIARYKVVRNYPPQVGRRVLGEHFDVLSQVNMKLDSLLPCEEDLSDVIDQIRVYLHERMQAEITDEVMEETLQQISGELYSEYSEVRTILEKARPLVTETLVRKVKEKFKPIHNRIASDLARLDLLVSPPCPQLPDQNWDADTWVHWALESYLPYHFWQEEAGKYDEEVANYAEQYQDWYFQNYLILRNHHPQMLHRAILNVRDELGNSEKVLFIVLDNFNYKFLPVLEELMHGRGYLLQAQTPYLALIPTETEVCKKCLLTGEPERSRIGRRSYEDIVTRDWQNDITRRSTYLSNVTQLQELNRLDADIYFLNYRALDELLHDTDEHTGIPHSEGARTLLRALVEMIDEFARRFQIEDELVIHVISDHGSTKIAADMVNVIDQRFYQKASLNKHHRFVTITGEQLKRLPDNTEFQCYVLDRHKYGLDHNYLIARRYYRFLKTDDSFYVHGGLTPEETIVPFVTFRKAPVEIKEPTITLRDSTFRYNIKSVVILDIVNPNEYPLQNIDIKLEAVDLDYETLLPLDELPALSSIEISISCRFRKSERDSKQLLVRLTYEFAGHRLITSREFTITVKSMMEHQPRRFR
ncbi:MAG: PglZ domain-containing protein [Candidatus Latescibacteria bacterium]|nr:PglZ domain-containing protein [Candidatus Latescibacterota bacterium]